MTLRRFVTVCALLVVGYSVMPLFADGGVKEVGQCCSTESLCSAGYLCLTIPGDDCGPMNKGYCIPSPGE